jgi:hypothetical protein
MTKLQVISVEASYGQYLSYCVKDIQEVGLELGSASALHIIGVPARSVTAFSNTD